MNGCPEGKLTLVIFPQAIFISHLIQGRGFHFFEVLSEVVPMAIVFVGTVVVFSGLTTRVVVTMREGLG